MGIRLSLNEDRSYTNSETQLLHGELTIVAADESTADYRMNKNSTSNGVVPLNPKRPHFILGEGIINFISRKVVTDLRSLESKFNLAENFFLERSFLFMAFVI